jgi:outer membrane protein
MNSKSLWAICLFNLILLLVFIGYSFFGKSERIAYVDSNKLVNGYQGMIDAREVYQKKAAGWKANIDTLANEVQQQIFQYEKDSPKMSAKERELSKELIRTKQKQLADYQQALNSQAQQEDSQMTNDVMTQMNAYIKKYGENNNYKIVFAATEYGNIAYADESLDITEKVLEGLNNEYKGK